MNKKIIALAFAIVVTPAHPASNKELVQILAGTVVVMVCGALGFQGIKYSQRKADQDSVNNVKAFDPRNEFAHLITIIENPNALETLAEYCAAKNISIRELRDKIDNSLQSAEKLIATLATNYDYWRAKELHPILRPLAQKTLHDPAVKTKINLLRRLHNIFNEEYDYLVLNKKLYLAKKARIDCNARFKLLEEAALCDTNITQLTDAINAFKSTSVNLMHHRELKEAAQNYLHTLQQKIKNLQKNPNYISEINTRALWQQQQQQLAMQQQLVNAQATQARALREQSQANVAILHQQAAEIIVLKQNRESLLTKIAELSAKIRELEQKNIQAEQAKEELERTKKDLKTLRDKIKDLKTKIASNPPSNPASWDNAHKWFVASINGLD